MLILLRPFKVMVDIWVLLAKRYFKLIALEAKCEAIQSHDKCIGSSIELVLCLIPYGCRTWEGSKSLSMLYLLPLATSFRLKTLTCLYQKGYQDQCEFTPLFIL